MPAQSRIGKKERKQLKVTWVGKPQAMKVGSNIKILRFTCDDKLHYETFKQNLFSHIKVGEQLDADTELQIVTTEAGQEYPHWRITQIYQDGKPVAVSQADTPKRAYGKSPEELALHRQLDEFKQNSIMAQTALNRAVDLAIADKITLEGIKAMAEAYYLFLEGLCKVSDAEVIHDAIKKRRTKEDMGIPRQETKADSGETVGSTPKTVATPEPKIKPDSGEGTGDKPEAGRPEIPKTKQELIDWAFETYNKTPNEIRETLGLKEKQTLRETPGEVEGAFKRLQEKWGE